MKHDAHLLMSLGEPGTPPRKQELIVEPFVQLTSTLTRIAEGTGLGLAISRELVRAMRGDCDRRQPGRAGIDGHFSSCPGRNRTIPASVRLSFQHSYSPARSASQTTCSYGDRSDEHRSMAAHIADHNTRQYVRCPFAGVTALQGKPH